MAFTDFKNPKQVLTTFNLTYCEKDFIIPTAFEITPHFQEMFTFRKTYLNTQASEAAICEMIIFPILEETFKKYVDIFTLWSHQSIHYDDVLTGIPDYLIATQSKHGKIVLGYPLLTAVEAKQNNFIKGWGQCLAEMVALQKLNDDTNLTVYGIVTDGDKWQFGKLINDEFIKNRSFLADDLETLFGAINYIFAHLKKQLEQL